MNVDDVGRFDTQITRITQKSCDSQHGKFSPFLDWERLGSRWGEVD